MTNGLSEQPSLREHVERYLAAVADKLPAYGIQARLSSDDGTLLATDSHSGRAGTILTVLNAISPGMTSTAAMPAAW
jgi:hypothetical protein